jgi:hypothetical protein
MALKRAITTGGCKKKIKVSTSFFLLRNYLLKTIHNVLHVVFALQNSNEKVITRGPEKSRLLLFSPPIKAEKEEDKSS